VSVVVEVDVGEIVSAAELGTGALLNDGFRFADVGVAAGKVILDGDPFIAEITFHTCCWAILVFVLEPFTSSELDDSATVAFDV
jgi:hypothetical protein